MRTRTFDLLSPDLAMVAVERSHGLRLDGTVTTYPSYVNRVYGLRDEEGKRFVAKFYRPGRWSREAILEEHRFVLDCAAAELPVVAPLANGDGSTLATAAATGPEGSEEFFFALYPLRAGRGFDAEGEEDWLRLGAIVGRVHAVAAAGEAPHRLLCLPSASTRAFVEELRAAGVVTPDCREEFFGIAAAALDAIEGLFEGVATHRIHGDCHRGNILDRPGEGLLLIDFDDMMRGPAVQDLWLLLPDHASSCRRELALILEGYEQFRPFDPSTLRLIEPLRLMRMLYYVAWQARQRNDARFRESQPGWGSKAFWLLEIEDLSRQLEWVREEG
jgi:Ser/Thr protein kinase RdoA (MazF antagonist)